MFEAGDLVSYELAGLEAGQLTLDADPPPGILLRLANSAAGLEADLPALVELCEASLLPAAAPVPAGDEGLACAEVAGLARHPGLAPPGVLVAFDGPLAVGMAVGRVEMPAAAESTRRAAVELLVVRPGYRRRGIARALLGRLLAWLAERGVETVVATTDQPVVAAMLKRYGFRPSTAD